MKWLRLLIITTATAAMSITAASTAMATEDPPDSVSIISAQVTRNNAEEGDMTIVFHYNIAYETYPDTPASSTIMFRLYSTDGETLLASAYPYVYFNNGYGQGVSSWYFAAGESPDWGEAYIINIAGSPAHFDPLPEPYNYSLTTADYSSTEDQETNQELLKSYILSVCELMEQAEPDYALYGDTDVGTVLTSIGESYFRAAIPGITSLAPSLFYTQFYVPEEIELEYTTDLADTYAGRLEDSDVMVGMDRVGEKAGINGQTVAAFIVVIFAIALIVWTVRKGWGAEPGIIGAGIIMTCGALLLGDAILILRIIMALIGGLLIMHRLFLKRA